jgi:PAS domain S-box-containing protein
MPPHMERGRAQTATPDNNLFYDAFNASPVGIAVEDLEGQPLFVNPALCSMLGFSNQELCSKHCVDFSPPEDAQKDWALFQQLRAGSIDHYQMEKRYFRRDGSLVWGRLSVSLFKSYPSPLVVALVEEITDKKKAEQALRTSEERLRLAQQAAHIGAFERNVRTGVVTWTPELESLYGLPPGAFGGTSTAFQNLVHPDDRARLIELTDVGERTGQPTRGEWRAVWPDGSVHWIAGRWQVFKDESGEPLRVFGVHIDITERKRAQEALLEVNRTLEAQAALLQSSEDLLKIFVKNVPVGVAMFDRDMRYLQVSDRWCADYSVDSSQVLGRSHYELFPDIPQRWKEMHRRGLDGETLRAEEDRWDREGGTTWLRWEIRPWRTPNGIVGGVLIFAEQITHRKQMEETISGMSKKLIESQEQERARIGRELHDDINQRLALLALELEQLRDNPSEVRSHVQDLLKQTTEISSDVQALSHDLDASKLEYLGALGGMRSWCTEFGERQGIQIDFKSPEARAAVPREIGLCLFRVLQEALNNAAKYSGVRQIEVQLREDSSEVHLFVTDSGRGFDLETARQGRGLGLTSMQERVRLVHGILEIRSTPMGGTTVHVRVPLTSEPLNANAAAV